ncbi:Histone-lysine N-methyltransferase, H3 lysine-4 specific [Smittium mucronatum]|uniref:Histone-lysine N-methyltransferase, H3 lysine-4 specific n=1 Tax=Smittium mucronatum TaxID=133383 RepID=A0A1R0GSL4_9FUNG|nr:Histone-lysine N-methyltransferase, H3 lysine-4 specific [Smittium mucronatum]
MPSNDIDYLSINSVNAFNSPKIVSRPTSLKFDPREKSMEIEMNSRSLSNISNDPRTPKSKNISSNTDPRKSSAYNNLRKSLPNPTVLLATRFKKDRHTVQSSPNFGIVISKLSPLVTSDQLHNYFEDFGYISKIRLARDPSTGMSLGIALVEFGTFNENDIPRVSAKNAFDSLDYLTTRFPGSVIQSNNYDLYTKLVQKSSSREIKELGSPRSENNFAQLPIKELPPSTPRQDNSLSIRFPENSLIVEKKLSKENRFALLINTDPQISKLSYNSLTKFIKSHNPAILFTKKNDLYVVFSSEKELNRFSTLLKYSDLKIDEYHFRKCNPEDYNVVNNFIDKENSIPAPIPDPLINSTPDISLNYREKTEKKIESEYLIPAPSDSTFRSLKDIHKLYSTPIKLAQSLKSEIKTPISESLVFQLCQSFITDVKKRILRGAIESKFDYIMKKNNLPISTEKVLETNGEKVKVISIDSDQSKMNSVLQSLPAFRKNYNKGEKKRAFKRSKFYESDNGNDDDGYKKDPKIDNLESGMIPYSPSSDGENRAGRFKRKRLQNHNISSDNSEISLNHYDQISDFDSPCGNKFNEVPFVSKPQETSQICNEPSSEGSLFHSTSDETSSAHSKNHSEFEDEFISPLRNSSISSSINTRSNKPKTYQKVSKHFNPKPSSEVHDENDSFSQRTSSSKMDRGDFDSKPIVQSGTESRCIDSESISDVAENSTFEDISIIDIENFDVIEDTNLPNSTGSARTQGYYKIPKSDKSSYLLPLLPYLHWSANFFTSPKTNISIFQNKENSGKNNLIAQTIEIENGLCSFTAYRNPLFHNTIESHSKASAADSSDYKLSSHNQSSSSSNSRSHRAANRNLRAQLIGYKPINNINSESSISLGTKKENHFSGIKSEQTSRVNSSSNITNALNFNSLESRKKSLYFAKSGIHDYGLFTREHIYPGEFVIEYIGEIIRPSLADLRERRYHTEIGLPLDCCYLFKIDNETVVDATLTGNIARFVNHSCDPNCIAKVIVADGSKRIGIYAKSDINIGDEITYDYKFSVEDSENKIPCLCNTEACRGFLN